MTPHDKEAAWAEIAVDLVDELIPGADALTKVSYVPPILHAFEKVEDEVFRRIVANLKVERK